MNKKRLVQLIKKLYFLKYKLHEHTFEKRIKYLCFNRDSRVLAVIFSGMDADDKNRLYNYVKGFADVPVDLLYLSDPFGFRGSYFWKENGSDEPLRMTQRLLRNMIDRKKYECVCFLGTSKGGSAAILHGALLGADYILSGANQYNIGSYVAMSPDIFRGMTGEDVNKAGEDKLNSEYYEYFSRIPKTTQLLALYSDNEATYQRDTLDMLSAVKVLQINCEEKRCDFRHHDDVGNYFKPWAKDFLLGLHSRFDKQ